jgi:hypothetical protein
MIILTRLVDLVNRFRQIALFVSFDSERSNQTGSRAATC